MGFLASSVSELLTDHVSCTCVWSTGFKYCSCGCFDFSIKAVFVLSPVQLPCTFDWYPLSLNRTKRYPTCPVFSSIFVVAGCPSSPKACSLFGFPNCSRCTTPEKNLFIRRFLQLFVSSWSDNRLLSCFTPSCWCGYPAGWCYFTNYSLSSFRRTARLSVTAQLQRSLDSAESQVSTVPAYNFPFCFKYPIYLATCFKVNAPREQHCATQNFVIFPSNTNPGSRILFGDRNRHSSNVYYNYYCNYCHYQCNRDRPRPQLLLLVLYLLLSHLSVSILTVMNFGVDGIRLSLSNIRISISSPTTFRSNRCNKNIESGHKKHHLSNSRKLYLNAASLSLSPISTASNFQSHATFTKLRYLLILIVVELEQLLLLPRLTTLLLAYDSILSLNTTSNKHTKNVDTYFLFSRYLLHRFLLKNSSDKTEHNDDVFDCRCNISSYFNKFFANVKLTSNCTSNCASYRGTTIRNYFRAAKNCLVLLQTILLLLLLQNSCSVLHTIGSFSVQQRQKAEIASVSTAIINQNSVLTKPSNFTQQVALHLDHLLKNVNVNSVLCVII